MRFRSHSGKWSFSEPTVPFQSSAHMSSFVWAHDAVEAGKLQPIRANLNFKTRFWRFPGSRETVGPAGTAVETL
eukprot:5763510-Pyramimonas_sp.AAC.1